MGHPDIQIINFPHFVYIQFFVFFNTNIINQSSIDDNDYDDQDMTITIMIKPTAFCGVDKKIV